MVDRSSKASKVEERKQLAVDESEEEEWDMEVHARYFMGYFWWQWKRREYSFVETWWAFFYPGIRRSLLKTFFFQVGLSVGFMLARVFLIPKQALEYFELDSY